MTEDDKPPMSQHARIVFDMLTQRAPEDTKLENYCRWCDGPCRYKVDPAEGEGLDYRFKRELK